jgi:16S rRNA (guanine527-N7)-methyltransferase
VTPTDRESRLVTVLEQARASGFLGKGPIQDHLEHARALITAIPSGAITFVDLGSGGGIPGLVVALDRPDSTGLLLEGSTRRAAFLRTAVRELALTERVAVLPDRAENVGRTARWRDAVDVVVARSFGSPAVVAECAAPLLRVGGVLIVSDPPAEAARGDRWPPEGLAPLGLRPLEHRAGPPAFTVLEQADPCPDRFPRSVGMPAKRPLF